MRAKTTFQFLFMLLNMKLFRKDFRICIVFYCFILFVLFALNEFNQRNDYSNTTVVSPNIAPVVEHGIESDVLKIQHIVAIWGDMKIARYLWFDILDAGKNMVHNVENFSFRLISNSSESLESRMLLLVGNGRSEANIAKMKAILDHLMGREKLKDKHKEDLLKKFFDRPRTKVGLVMIGHELCKNDWIKDYLSKYGGILKVVFVTYNAVEISKFADVVFRWPLGVASYRHFPPLISISFDLNFRRPYFCNFMGTVYKSSSRQVLVDDLGGQNSGKPPLCFMGIRNEWLEHEPQEQAFSYHYVLKNSDFTLCPVGLNEETYRIYEALSMGSIPIIEDRPPSFVADEHENLANKCYSNGHGLNLDAAAAAAAADDDPLLSFIPAGENLKFNDFLTEEGGYFFDVASRKVFSMAGYKRWHPHNWNSTAAQWHSCCHHFLKRYRAPVLFVRTITRDLITTLRLNLTKKDILAWRKLIVAWYQDFRRQVKEHFFDTINHVLKPKIRYTFNK